MNPIAVTGMRNQRWGATPGKFGKRSAEREKNS